jgi:nucleotide-binding universal stress UspA family protein
MGPVVTGTDGSVSGQAAVEWATSIAARIGVQLVVVHAWHPSFAEVPPGVDEELRAEAARRLADEWCSVARDADVDPVPVLVEGDPRDLLLRTADEYDAGLLVVGARGAGSHTHALHLGSVTHHLVHHTERPLAAIPATSGPLLPERILVGVDGSAGSARAVEWCVTMASALSAEVIAVYGEAPLAEWVSHSDPHSWYQQAREKCEAWSTPLRDAGVSSQAMVVDHEPVTALTETALREHAGMIVVGTHGRGAVTGVRLGSTALKVLHRSGLPVALVPTGGES